jgi:hypothetical protein
MISRKKREAPAKPKVYDLAPTMAPEPKARNSNRSPDLQELGGAEGIRTPDPLDANEVRYRTALQPQERQSA